MLENKRKEHRTCNFDFSEDILPIILSRLQFPVTRWAELHSSSDHNEPPRPHCHLKHLPHNYALSKVSLFHELHPKVEAHQNKSNPRPTHLKNSFQKSIKGNMMSAKKYSQAEL